MHLHLLQGRRSSTTYLRVEKLAGRLHTVGKKFTGDVGSAHGRHAHSHAHSHSAVHHHRVVVPDGARVHLVHGRAAHLGGVHEVAVLPGAVRVKLARRVDVQALVTEAAVGKVANKCGSISLTRPKQSNIFLMNLLALGHRVEELTLVAVETGGPVLAALRRLAVAAAVALRDHRRHVSQVADAVVVVL